MNLPDAKRALTDTEMGSETSVDTMIRRTDEAVSASDFLPEVPQPTLEQLRVAADACRGCELYRDATQTVFGQGPEHARLVMVGEQPGNQEDLNGEPFVGPAGQLLREVMDEVDLPADAVYITNAVKHFKFRQTGARRLHVKPSSREISACRPWLDSEITAIRPEMVICLGATAAGTILGRQFRITQDRGKVIASDYADWTMATYHPSALLRVPDPAARTKMRAMFTEDLQLAAEHLRELLHA